MSEIIYNILILATSFLGIVFIVFTITTIIKKKSININVKKTKIVLASILLALSIIQMILALILGKSIINAILCAIAWGICTALHCRSLKYAKESVNYDFHVMPGFRDIYDDDIINGGFREITDEDNN